MDTKKWVLECLPDEIRREIEKCAWEQNTVGMSGAYTYRLTDAKKQNRYLKIMPKVLNNSLKRETEIMKWLEGKLPVPKVLLFINDQEYEYLLMTEVEGAFACDPSFNSDMPRLVRLLAEGLRMIHSIDIKECPFDSRLEIKLKEAEYRVKNGLVDEDNFDHIRQGMKDVEVLEELYKLKPADEDLVFTHGDYCLPNIFINNGKLSGFIDWGRGGVADRYQDLALAARSLEHNFDAKWVPLLFKEYGIENIDYSKVEYYKLLDELF
ncbi:MAG TPA: aminoglycoside 3'-phosphotransferase [Mobilitalea sp.]|nr:aminoglycoside 3'-phosphotransferase [Mobilitalea sp.]